MLTKLFFTFLFTISLIYANAQELDCKVQVLSQRATTTDNQIFKTLETSIFEFMNNTKWTEHVMGVAEKIECSLFINITDDDGSGNFRANVTIQSSRPIFNSAYNSVLLNYSDQNWRFEYVQFQPLRFTKASYTDNLTSLLAFYAYIIIGMDYDSYSLKGGSPYFQMAQEIVNLIPQNSAFASGWRPNDDIRNRYWMVENILNPKYEKFRILNYEYHRLAMDNMYNDVRKSRLQITELIKSLEPIFVSNPNAMILQMLMNAKQNEFIGLYSGAPPQEKNEAVNLLTKYDPVNGQRYAAINKK